MKLSIIIITLNAEAKIAEAVKSAGFADEVLVVDSGSTDKTVTTATSLGARVVHQAWQGFGKQKQTAVDLARNDWVFILDSDERITPDLQDEIQRTLEHPVCAGYRVARLNYFFGKLIRRGGFYPDYSIRLFNKRSGKLAGDAVHEKVLVTGNVGELQHPMIHLACDDVEHFISKSNQYSSLSRKRNLAKALLNPVWTFVRMYFLKLGFLDGREGLVLALLYSQYTFWKYIK